MHGGKIIYYSEVLTVLNENILNTPHRWYDLGVKCHITYLLFNVLLESLAMHIMVNIPPTK